MMSLAMLDVIAGDEMHLNTDAPRALTDGSPPAPLGVADDESAERRLPRVARLLVPLLGIFFLVYPIEVVLASDPTPMWVAIAVGGAALFACGFLRLMWRHDPLQLVPAQPLEIVKLRAAVVILAALAGVLSSILGPEWWVLVLFHVNVAAGIMLLKRDAYVTVAVVAVLTFVHGFSSGMAWLIVPTAGIGLWAIAFVSQVGTVAELRVAREELARRALAEQRLRFARDLHDLLGHSLSLIALKSELAGRLLPAAPERAGSEIREVEAVAREALREVREAVYGYRRPTLGDELAGAGEMLEAAGIAGRIENDAGPLPKPVEATLAWAVREGATNVIRHSRARHCTVRVGREDGTAYAEVRDDGRGRVRAGAVGGRSTGGSGLAGLAERVADVAGARFEAGPLPEGGFRLRVDLPLRDGAAGPALEAGRR
jgi:two-component system sensor histidine kinase DesK